MVKVTKPGRSFSRVPPLLFHRFLGHLVNQAVTSRMKLSVGEMDGDDGLDAIGRNLYAECGYPLNPSIRTYRRLYEREGYATRVVHLWPDECWAVRPTLYEVEDKRITKFERAWATLNKRIDVWHYLHRLDRIAGIGTFGVLLLGFDDGKKLSRPAPGFTDRRKIRGGSPRKTELLYCQAYAEDSIVIKEVERDTGHPRYGKPLMYELTVSTPDALDQDGTDVIDVHWSRVIHFADNCESDEIRGTPRQQAVVNRLLDIRKTLGGSAEMFYKGAFPGMLATTQEDIDGSVVDEDTVREQFEEYMNGLKRYMAFDGMNVQQLLPQVADPTQHIMQQVTAICATIGCPVPVFLGQQEGHLAGMSNDEKWNRRVGSRNETTTEPRLIRPTIDRLIDVGVLPGPGEGEYLLSFRDINTMSDKDRADVSLKKAQALMQYVTGQVESVVPLHQFLTHFMGMTEKEAKAITDAAAANKDKQLTDPIGDKKAERDAKLQIKVAKATPKPATAVSRPRRAARPQGGGRRGASSGGRPSGTVSRS